MSLMNYYELLEVNENASQEVIRMAYKALCKKYHPDVYEGDKRFAEEQIKKINEAYAILSDFAKRKQYDNSFKNKKHYENRKYTSNREEYKGTNIETLLKRGFMALEDGEWIKADNFFEQVLNQDAELAEAYLGKLMVELQVKTKDTLKDYRLPFNESSNYKRAYCFADNSLRGFIVSAIEHINKRNYDYECNSIYNEACELMDNYVSILSLEKALELFLKISDYKDSSVKIQECEEKIAIIKEQIVKDEQIALEKKKKVFKIASITTPIVAVILATIILITTVIIPKSKYNDAMKLFESGKYLEAIEICNTIEQYDYAKELLEKSYYKLGILHFEKNEFELAYNYLVNSKDYKDSYDLRKSIMSKYFQDKKGKISAGMRVSLGLNADGTVRVVGDDISTQEIELVNKWTNIKEVSAGAFHLVALCSDGTVVTANAPWSELLEVNSWKNIVSVSAGMWHTVGLRSDGTVVAVGEKSSSSNQIKEVSKWKDIIEVSASSLRTVGLKSDGTVISTKYNPTTYSTYVDQVDVSVFKNIVAISSEDDLVAGLKSDGTVIATGDNGYGQCEVSNWKDIVDISVNDWNTFGLKADGTVVVAGELKDDKRFSSLNGIVDISVGYSHFLGLKTDGTVISIRIDDIGSGAECNVQDWDLY